MDTIRVALIEDNPEFLRRFAGIVGAAEDLVLAGCAASAAEGHALAAQCAADVYLVDLGLPDGDGIDIIARIAAGQPAADVMVITVFGDDEHVLRSLEAGAAGYLLKDALPAEIVACIRELRQGGSPLSPSIARRLLRRFRAPPAAANASPLSAREGEILTLVAKGLSFAEVGKTLVISPHTVTAHVRKIYRKLAVNSRSEAVFEARQMGLLK